MGNKRPFFTRDPPRRRSARKCVFRRSARQMAFALRTLRPLSAAFAFNAILNTENTEVTQKTQSEIKVVS